MMAIRLRNVDVSMLIYCCFIFRVYFGYTLVHDQITWLFILFGAHSLMIA